MDVITPSDQHKHNNVHERPQNVHTTPKRPSTTTLLGGGRSDRGRNHNPQRKDPMIQARPTTEAGGPPITDRQQQLTDDARHRAERLRADRRLASIGAQGDDLAAAGHAVPWPRPTP